MPLPSANPRDGQPVKHRAWTRFRGTQDIRRQADQADSARLGRVHSISADGITLLLGQRVNVGMVLSLELVTKTDGSRRLVVQVVQATRQPHGRWAIRCAFAEPFCEKELHALLKE